MFDFAPTHSPDGPATDKPELYRELKAAALALTDGEPDGIANMANLAALIWTYLPDLNWAGFYRLAPEADELILGPFIGKPAYAAPPRPPRPANASSMSTHSPATSPATPTASPNWSYR